MSLPQREVVTTTALPEVPEGIGPPPEVPSSPPLVVEPSPNFATGEDDAERVTFPYPENEYRCPACERPIPTRKQIRMAKPARYEHALNDVFKCPWCNFIFSPKVVVATVLRK